ncbi:MAG: biotin/lipoyl-binding protein [Bacteroidales bacterium]|nr:biotin/lipoyl-binding protein [Bacteroidales bacterium]
MKSYNFTINGNKYHVDIVKHEDRDITLEVNGTSYVVSTDKMAPTKAPSKTPMVVRKDATPSVPVMSGTSVAQTIKAPLPGNILNILVKEGDSVQKGQKLLVYEAMKMENDVLAEGNGVVSKIFVSVGDTILQGATLMDIK